LIKSAEMAATALIILTGPLLRNIGKWPGNYPMFLRQADRFGVQVRRRTNTILPMPMRTFLWM
jgi:hypothetical protein